MEIEAKYSVPSGETFARLLALSALDAYDLRLAGQQHVTDRYLDTPARDLERGGYACRVRENGGEWLATVKSLGGAQEAVHQRQEFETAIPPGTLDPQAWPTGPGRDLVLALSQARTLAELFVIRQQRARRTVWQGERHVADLSLDVVQIKAGEQNRLLREVEIELSPSGTVTDLQALGAALAPYALEPQPRSKFERALSLLDGRLPAEAPPARKRRKTPGVLADLPMAEAGRRILAFHFERMLANEAGAREGTDIEALHDMRVATRRQRAAIRTFAPYFRRKAIRPIRRALQALGERMGAVRDLDVLIEAAKEYQAALDEAEARAFQPLVDEWLGQREGARAELLAHLDGDGYRAFTERYAAFLETEGAGVRREAAATAPQPHLVQHVLPRAVWDHYGAVRAYETVLAWAPIETLHTLRIEGKRLRYLLEFFREVLDPCVAEAIEDLVALQDHIGELHDTDVMIKLVQAFLMQGVHSPLASEVVETVGGYLTQRQKRLRKLQRTVSRPWRRVNSVRFRKLLGRAVAQL